MLKQSLLVVLAAGIISTATPFATAQNQDQDNNAPSGQQSGPPQRNGGWHHGPPDPAERTQELTKKLNLNADQQTKVQEILRSERTQMESLRKDSSGSQSQGSQTQGSQTQDDRRSKMMDIHKSSEAQVRALLDSTQQKKWDEMQARRGERMGGRRGGPPEGGDQQGPPPQQ